MIKIAVIDDENVVRNGIVLETDWAALGCEVVAEASDGEEGLRIIEAYRPDIVISDIRMPKLDGLSMLKALREKGDNTYVIFLSAYSDFSYAQQAIHFGAADYLLKPFEDGDLERAINEIKGRLGQKQEDADSFIEEEVLARAAMQRGDKSQYVADAISYIGAHLSDPDMNIRGIASAIGLSESHLSHLFRKETEYTVNVYITRCRVRTAMKLLREKRHKVYEIAELVGYRDIAYFSNIFKKITGLTPSEYQEKI